MYALSGGLQVEPAPVLGEIQSSVRTRAFSKKLVVQEEMGIREINETKQKK